MTKDEFVTERTKIISNMLDHPNKYGIFPTTKCFAAFDDLFDKLCVEFGQQPYDKSGAQKLAQESPDALTLGKKK